MIETVYILGILLQATASVIALLQVRCAPHRLPWLLIAVSSLLIVIRRAATLEEFLGSGRQLAGAEIVTLLISLLFFLGVLLISRMFHEVLHKSDMLRKTEEALRERESLLQSVVDNTPVDFWACDRSGRYIMENPAIVRHWGRLVGKLPEDAGIAESYVNIWKANQRRAFSGEVVQDEIAYPNPDGKKVFQHIIAPIRDGNDICGLVGFDLDVTSRKAAEDELRKRNEDLMHFNNIVSHDLRGPLVTIKTFLGYLEQDMHSDPDKTAKDFAFIRSAVDAMNGMIVELLSISSIGREHYPASRMQLQEVVRAALDLVAGTDRIQTKVTEKPLTVCGERPRLVEAFQKLIENAVRSTADQDRPRVEIGFEEREGETALFVRDNGRGIDPGSLNAPHGDPIPLAAGLGLPLVKRIVEAHGGRIWAESEGLGKGACFWFTLPGRNSGFRIQD